MIKLIAITLSSVLILIAFPANAKKITVSALDTYGIEGDLKMCPIEIGMRSIKNEDVSNSECDNGFTMEVPAGKTLTRLGIITSDNSDQCSASLTLAKQNVLSGVSTGFGSGISSQDGDVRTPRWLDIDTIFGLAGDTDVFVAQTNIHTMNYSNGVDCKIYGFIYKFE